MKTPQKLENADGSPNAGGSLQYYTELEVAIRGNAHPLRFYIADMGSDDLVLGYPWFTATNIQPNWKNSTIPDPIIIRTLGAASGKPKLTMRIATMATIDYDGTYCPPNHPAFSEVQGPDAQVHLTRHSSPCRFLLRGAEKHGSTAVSNGTATTVPQKTVQVFWMFSLFYTYLTN